MSLRLRLPTPLCELRRDKSPQHAGFCPALAAASQIEKETNEHRTPACHAKRLGCMELLSYRLIEKEVSALPVAGGAAG
ncbi:MAG: hypothetical protein GY850_31610 [bacterium]|nr:hypothetical protein [bacterium]